MSLVHSTHDKTLLFFGPGLKEIAAVSPDIGNEALGPTIALTVLATMVVGLRCWTRVYIVKGLGVDDYVILVSLEVLASNTLYHLLLSTTKFSILLQYTRLFTSPTLLRLTHLLMFLLLPAVSWGVFGGLFMCSPVRKFWLPHVVGTCMDSQKYWLSTAGTNIWLDFLVLALPVPVVWGLRCPRRQKVGCVGVFLLGFL
ncbi:hypothetical protein M8818_005256 [Zalaria obscura]|uniref:Uncharacterized protein n=1 Tax=Zalaria obscura TaxID=2024903 RepID=A0ACC3SB29_9PEZI